MLACLLKGPGNVVLENRPVPRIGKGDVLVRMKACGICGTDLEKVGGELDPFGILGHEPCGVVERQGKSVTSVKPGDRVVAHHHVPCYQCNTCSKGDYTMCDQFKRTNIDPCGLADFFRVPEFNVSRGALVKIPDNMDFEEGAMIEPTGCCIRAVKKAGIKPGNHVVILGLGPTGLTQVQLIRPITNGKIIGVDFMKSRLKAASELGADEVIVPGSNNDTDLIKKITEGGADLVMVSTGNPKAIPQALFLMRKGGKIVLFGAPGRESMLALDAGSMFSRQVQIITSYSCVEAEMQEAIDLVVENRLDLKRLITDRFKLQDAVLALESARTSKISLKTMIVT